jgi:hypothetical protein
VLFSFSLSDRRVPESSNLIPSLLKSANMRYSKLAVLAAATAVSAQRPEDESICDYYTTALLKNNTAENQATLLTLVVNTAVIGNCTYPPSYPV